MLSVKIVASSMQQHLWELINIPAGILSTKESEKTYQKFYDIKKDYSIYFLPAALRAEDTFLIEPYTL